ncbi:hypothetical protein Sango_1440100 [Sesamum angolense]|uniref:Uncharacterized protein n=1 Tax=Sesamum angolense TaxID=2727404 RepID=A0AAE2BSK9_9LAMI|nr:hypothetical protein Sango_1440100 [Sesamum angolense]
MEVNYRTTTQMVVLLVLLLSSAIPTSLAYRPGDFVPMSRMGQYHATRTVWHDMIGRHCPIFAVNREALIPIPKPTGYTGADPYKISFQVGREKFYVPWLFVINRKSSEVPMIEMNLGLQDGVGLLGFEGTQGLICLVTAKVVDMPNSYVELHPDIRNQFWDQQQWPKHILVRYTWEEQSEIDVASGFMFFLDQCLSLLIALIYSLLLVVTLSICSCIVCAILEFIRVRIILCHISNICSIGPQPGLMLSFVLAIYVLQSSQDKLTRFVKEAVAETNMPAGGVAKVE